jgi:hypothetical protein
VRSELPQDVTSFPNYLQTVDVQGPQSEEDLLAFFGNFYTRMASLPRAPPHPPVWGKIKSGTIKPRDIFILNFYLRWWRG